jgi:VWFA-related protein
MAPVLVALGTGAVHAQPPVFRTGADAVVLDIVVRDRRGRPVRDLARDEVVVLEDGQPRQVLAFRLVEGAAEPATLETGAASPDPLRRITLVTLVFDRLTQGARQLARRAALEFVAKELPPGQWVSVFTLDDRLTLRQDFTRDRAKLSQAIERAMAATTQEAAAPLPGASREQTPTPTAAIVGGDAPAAPPGGGAAAGAAAAQAAMDAVVGRIQAFTDSAEQQQRGQSALFPLMSLARAEAALEGRKAVLFFSEGFTVPPNLEEAYRNAISEANRANVSIYAVDARGLDTGRALAAAGAALEKAGRTSQQEMLKRGAGAVTMDEVMNTETAQSALQSHAQGVLEELAESTGGFLIANSNDLRVGLDRVTGDLASYYEMAYAPQAGPFDGRFRKVEVKVTRKGVTVQTRAGYFALPPSDAAPLMPYELPLLAAAAASPAPHAFDYKVAAFRFQQTPRGRQHTLVVEVPTERLTIAEQQKTKRYSLRFSLLALVKDASGRIVERLSNDYPLEGALDRLPALRRGLVVFKRQVWLPPGHYTVVTVARDHGSGRDSVQELPLDTPDERDGVRVSSLAVIRRVDQAGAEPDAVEDPFRTGPMRIVPSLDTPISKGATNQISAYVVIYTDPKTPGKPALTFEFLEGERVFGRSDAALPDADEQGRITYVASFPASGFAPGHYTLRAIARQGAVDDRTTTPFTVVP